MTFKKVTHVIFDMDGLLLDSEILYDRIIDEIAKKYGKEYTLEAKMKILGTPEPDTARIAVAEMQLPITPEQFLEEYTEKGKTELQSSLLFPGAEELIRHLHNHNIPIAIATSASNEATAIKIEKYQNLFSLFHHKVTGSSDPDVKQGKPSPDIYLVCASRFPDKPKPEQCLVLEDAPNGVTGAISAGMQVVMIPAKDVHQDLRKHATLTLESLTEFKPELFGLPAFAG